MKKKATYICVFVAVLILAGSVSAIPRITTNATNADASITTVGGNCPRCEEYNLVKYCSGNFHYRTEVNCLYRIPHQQQHPVECMIQQTYYWTDYGCPGTECTYYRSGVQESHLQAYYHDLVPDCKDDCYCTLRYILK